MVKRGVACLLLVTTLCTGCAMSDTKNEGNKITMSDTAKGTENVETEVTKAPTAEEMSGDGAWVAHYTMPPYDEKSFSLEYQKEEEWIARQNIDRRMEFFEEDDSRYGTVKKIEYKAVNDKSKILGYHTEYLYALLEPYMSVEEILRIAKHYFESMQVNDHRNTVQSEFVVKIKGVEKYHFWLRFADKERKEIVIFEPQNKKGTKGRYLTDEEWLAKQA